MEIMAKITGSTAQVVQVGTVGEARAKLNAQGYQATINGESVDDDNHPLNEGDYVVFAPKVKGA